MSYYMGDYYSGDPGFFGGIGRFLGRTARGVVGAIPGVGHLVSAAEGLFHRAPAIGRAVRGVGSTLTLPMGPPDISRLAGRIGLPAAMPGAGLMTLPPGHLPGVPMGRAEPCYRISARGRRIKINCRTGKQIRHMRVTNPKALRRAIRRANGFAKLARKVMHFTSPRAPKGRAVFRKRRAKK